MARQINIYGAALLLFGIIASCTSDPMAGEPSGEEETPLQLNGMLTRSLGDTDDPGDGQLITTGHPLEAYAGNTFFLTARTTDAPVSNYFLNRPVTVGAQNPTHEGRNRLNGTLYYPLGQKRIDLHAHTVAADANGNIILTAGTARTNDVLLGKGTEADGVTPKTGNSADPVEIITFKHLMTRVDIRIEVDDDVAVTNPVHIAMRFSRTSGNGLVVNRGRYNIFSGGNATGTASGEYGFSGVSAVTQTHYLVPNGANLSNAGAGQIVSYLKIDDYVVPQADLAPVRFPPTDKGNDFILKPGVAYDLVFSINRRKITEIQLRLKEWDAKAGVSGWGYAPKTMTLAPGDDYTVSEESKITKMVVKYDPGNGEVYQYTGRGRMDGAENKIDFVSLPPAIPAVTLTADLYTEEGLLASDVMIETSGSTLRILHLGKYGMKKNGDILEISTPLQFALMLNDAGKTAMRFAMVNDLDMGGNSLAICPAEFPAGSVLDGKGHDIIHLNIDGNGLFTENNGQLKNFRIASGLIKGSGSDVVGAVCSVNNGSIEAVVNQADIQPAATQTIAGGICGTNGADGTILAAVNAGDILGGITVGGIAGENNNISEGAFKACLNVGLLNKGATGPGGIAGTSVSHSSIVQTCYWLTGTARINQSMGEERAIGNLPVGEADTESADLAASAIRSVYIIGKLNLVSVPWEFTMNGNTSSWPEAISNL